MGIETALIGAAIIGAGSSVMQAQEAKKSNRAARKSEARQAFQQRVSALRETRLQAANAANAAAASGLGSSSGVQGQIAALNTSQNANIQFANELDAFKAQQLKAQDRMATWGLIGNIAQQAGGAITTFNNMPPKTKTE